MTPSPFSETAGYSCGLLRLGCLRTGAWRRIVAFLLTAMAMAAVSSAQTDENVTGNLLVSGNASVGGALSLLKLVGTGNNAASSSDPYAADVVIGSDAGTRHNSSIMFWSSGSAVRMLASSNSLQVMTHNTLTPAISLGTNGENSFFNSGNVGIGLTDPGVYKLKVGGDYPLFAYSVNGSGIILNPSYNYYDAYNHIFRTLNGAQTAMTIDNIGRVGIGTTSRGALLDVAGSVYVGGAITKQSGGSAYYGWGEIPWSDMTTTDLDKSRPNLPEGSVQRLNHHTGISLSAHSVYGGIRFYNQGYSNSNTNPFDSQTGATMAMAINNGNVGAGAANPGTKLVVFDASPILTLQDSSDNANFTGIGFSHSGTSIPGANASQGIKTMIMSRPTGAWGQSDLYFALNTAADNNNVTAADAKMVIKNTGDVGIGTSGPGSRLHVFSAGNNQLTVDRASAGNSAQIGFAQGGTNRWFLVDRDAGALHGSQTRLFEVYDAFAGPRLAVDNTGNVGIGTETPAERLDVAGNASISGHLNTGTLTVGNVTVDPASFVRNGVSSQVSLVTAHGASSGSISNAFVHDNTGTGPGTGSAISLRNNGNTVSSLGWNYSDNNGFTTYLLNNFGGVTISAGGNAGSSSPVARFTSAGTALAGDLSVAGNVSVGAPSARDKLEVNTSGTGGLLVTAYTNSTSIFSGGHAALFASKAFTGSLALSQGGNDKSVIQAFRSTAVDGYGASSEDASLLLNPNGGDVGIGTTTPFARVEVNSGGSAAGTLNIYSSHATFSAQTVAGTLSLGQNDTMGNNIPDAQISGINELANDSAQGALAFGTRTNGVVTEKMRITSAGDVGIGTSPATGMKLDVAGNASINGTLTVRTANLTALSVGNVSFGSPNDYIKANGNGNVAVASVTGAAASGPNTGGLALKAGATTDKANITLSPTGAGTTIFDGRAMTQNASGNQLGEFFSGNTNGGSQLDHAVRIGQSRVKDKDDALISRNLGPDPDPNSNQYKTYSTAPFAGVEFRNIFATDGQPATSTDTYFYSAGAPQAAGVPFTPVPSMVIAGATGNLGIGTTNPGAKLEVSGSATGYFGAAKLVNLTAEDNGSTGVDLAFVNDTAGSLGDIGAKLRMVRVGAWDKADLAFYTNGADGVGDLSTEKMRITSDGNVGIGTPSPHKNLEVSSTANTTVRIDRQSAGNAAQLSLAQGATDKWLLVDRDVGALLGGQTKRLDIYDPAVGERLSIDNSGRVGIGTTTPGEKLDVNGQINTISLNSLGNPVSFTAGGGLGLWGRNSESYAEIRAYSGASGAGKNLALQPTGGNVVIGTTGPIGRFSVNHGTDRNFAVMTDDWQWHTSGVAIGSFNDGANETRPLSIVGSSILLGGRTAIAADTPSTTPQTGALTILGGAGVGQNLNVGGALSAAIATVNGALTVSGDATLAATSVSTLNATGVISGTTMSATGTVSTPILSGVGNAGLNLDAGATNRNISLTTSGTGQTQINGSTQINGTTQINGDTQITGVFQLDRDASSVDYDRLRFSEGNTSFDIATIKGGNGALKDLTFSPGGSVAGTWKTSGNLLLGTSAETVAANGRGRLQIGTGTDTDVTGGIGFGGDTSFFRSGNNSLTASGNVTVAKQLTVSGDGKITSGTVSSSTSTGALTVTNGGGAGISGNLYVGGNTTITSAATSSTPVSGALIVMGGAGISGAVNTGGDLVVGTTSTAANATITGTATIGGSANISGSVTVSSTTYLRGHVGIGMAPGNYSLEVSGDAKFDNKLEAINGVTMGGWTLAANGGSLQFNHSGTSSVSLDASGNATFGGAINLGSGPSLSATGINLNSTRISGLPAPTYDGDATTKVFVEDHNALIWAKGSTQANFQTEITRVGLGTLAPAAPLHTQASTTEGEMARFTPSSAGTKRTYVSLNSQTAGNSWELSVQDLNDGPGSGLAFRSRTGAGNASISRLYVAADTGYVGIGTTRPTTELAVNGTIRTREVIVESDNWPDHVFAAGYRNRPLAEVEAQIKEKGHLPDVPSAQEVTEKGVGVGRMQAVLLSKIEELTLHLIEQEKRIKRLEEENASFKAVR